jgi:hypothetical protein
MPSKTSMILKLKHHPKLKYYLLQLLTATTAVSLGTLRPVVRVHSPRPATNKPQKINPPLVLILAF